MILIVLFYFDFRFDSLKIFKKLQIIIFIQPNKSKINYNDQWLKAAKKLNLFLIERGGDYSLN